MTILKQLNNVPFTTLKIVYFRAFDKLNEKIFLDANDEQILKLLAKEYCETVVIQKIETLNVLEVTAHVPNKRKLDLDELKMGLSNEEIAARSKKIAEYKEKYK